MPEDIEHQALLRRLVEEGELLDNVDVQTADIRELLKNLDPVILRRVLKLRSERQAGDDPQLTASDRMIEAVVRACYYIDEHLDGDLSIDAVAGHVHFSPYHFARGFRDVMGQTVHAYILRCRINRAQTLLTTTALPLIEVAYMTGFSSQSHFTVAFRRQVGKTPGRYRRAGGAN